MGFRLNITAFWYRFFLLTASNWEYQYQAHNYLVAKNRLSPSSTSRNRTCPVHGPAHQSIRYTRPKKKVNFYLIMNPFSIVELQTLNTPESGFVVPRARGIPPRWRVLGVGGSNNGCISLATWDFLQCSWTCICRTRADWIGLIPCNNSLAATRDSSSP